ncbi:chorismate lyase [Vibrio salinus]|uniref:chorismate lyase n=1 Tax=Vibrio salinus TaxID=2899784 RepID=UPI0035621743
MNQTFSLNLSQIKNIKWVCPTDFTFSSEKTLHWLSEQGSLSVLLKSHCDSLTVELLENSWVGYEQLQDDEKWLLPDQSHYLIRKVILRGDGMPWVFGYSVIPETTALSQHYDLTNIGELPLGETIFSANKVRRDCLMMSKIKNTDGDMLDIRRSRLWMEENPLLVTELFLSDSPIYA